MLTDYGLVTLLNLDGESFVYPCGYWWKINAKEVEPTERIPHGIRYNLTFHDPSGTRIFGMDNSHAPKNVRRGYHICRITEYDHVHKTTKDRGTPYVFRNAEKLIGDFFEHVDDIKAKLPEERWS